MVVGQRALAHQRVRDGQRQVLGELAHLGRSVGEQDAAADVEQRRPRFEQLADDLLGGLVVERGLRERLGVLPQALEQGDVDLLREDVHRHVDQHRPRPAAFGQRECLFDDLGEEVRRIHAPRPLDERPVDLVLRRVRVQIHFLVRVLAVVMRRHVAGDHHHRDRVERGVGHAGRGVGEPGREVRQHHRCLAGSARIAVGRMRGDLLVTRVDELDLLALRQRREHRDVGVAAQPEDVLDAARFQVFHELVRNLVFHCLVLRSGAARRRGRRKLWFSRRRPCRRRRRARRVAPARCSGTESPSAWAP